MGKTTTTTHLQMARYITAVPQHDQYGSYEHGLLYVRVPFNNQQQTTPDEVFHACQRFAENIECVWPADDHGGFCVKFGAGATTTPMMAAGLAAQTLHGAVDLTGQPPVHDTMPIHERVAGAVIGHGGENLRRIKQQSGAYVEVTPYDGCNATRQVNMSGSPQAVEAARQLVNQSTQQALRDRMAHNAPQQIPSVCEPAQCAGGACPGTWGQPQMMPQQMPTSPPAFPPLQAQQQSFTGLPWGPTPPFSSMPAPMVPIGLPQLPPPSTTSGIAITRVLSEKSLAQLPRAGWCLLKDRISLMNNIRDAASQFKKAKKAEKLKLQLGKRSMSAPLFLRSSAPTSECPSPTSMSPMSPARVMKPVVVPVMQDAAPAAGSPPTMHVQFGSLPSLTGVTA